MNRIIISFLLFSSFIFTLSAQEVKYLSASEISPSELIGDTITITEVELLKDVYWGIPDTIWIKKVRRPKLGKHYSLIYVYKGKGYSTDKAPKEEVINKQYKVLNFSEDSSSSLGAAGIRLNLLRLDTQEQIKIYSHSDVSFVINNLSKKYKDNIVGKVFYQLKDNSLDVHNPRNYKKVICTDCNFVYHHGPYSTYTGLYAILSSGYLFHVNNRKNEHVLNETEFYALQEENIQNLISEGEYKMFISNVRKNNQILKKGFSKDSITNSTTIEESNLKILITPTKEYFSITIENQSKKSIKLDWNEIVFVDENNNSQSVTHKGVKYVDANKPKLVSVIAPNSVLDDIVIPNSRLYCSSYDNEWTILAILNYVHKNGKYPVGTQVKLIIPLTINNVRNEYIFTYDVVWKYKNPEIRAKYLNYR